MKYIPKVLIIGHSFQLTGIGITLKNLFSQFPKENLACVAGGYCEQDKAFGSFYMLGNKEIKLMFPLNIVAKLPNSRIIDAVEHNCVETKKQHSALKRRFYIKYVVNLLKFLKLYNYRMSYVLSDDFIQWIGKFKPDIIYSALGSLTMTQFVYRIHEVFPQANVAIHIMDDWLSTQSKQILFSKRYQKRLNECFNLLIQKASFRIAISDKMAEVYKIRYGVFFETFHNPVDIETFSHITKEIKNDTTKRLVYVGKINKDTYDVLNDVITAVDQMNNTNLFVLFYIYTPSNQTYIKKYIKKSSNLIIHPCISHDFIPNILINSDMLVLPLSFTKHSKKYTRLSIATKITEYMASKTPILVYAPEDIAISEYVKKYKVALCVMEKNINCLKEGIYCLLTNNELTSDITKRAFNLVTAKHSLQSVSTSFFQLLSQNIHE